MTFDRGQGSRCLIAGGQRELYRDGLFGQ